MKIIFLVMALSSIVWAQSTTLGGSQTTPAAEEFDELLTCGTRARGFQVFKSASHREGPEWQGRLGGAGWADDGKYFGVTLSIRKEGAQCFVEVSSRERTMKFEYWVGSDLSRLKALSGPGLSASDRECSVDLLYSHALSACTYPVKIISERSPQRRPNCEITSYKTFRAAEIDFVAENSERVCIGTVYCVPRQMHDDDSRPRQPPYYNWVACLPASNGECLQSFNNCYDDEQTRPRDEAAGQRLRQTLGLPPRVRGQQ